MIGFFAQLNQGVGLIAWATFFAGLAPFLIVIASFFNQRAYWEIKRIDYFFAGIALIGLVLWQITKNANFALTFSILADLAVAIPTIIKSYTHPDSESPIAFGISSIGFLLAMLAIQEWNYESVAFIVYLFLLNGFITLLILRNNFDKFLYR